MNHFELFDLPVSTHIDNADLQQRYRRLQQALHPDRHAAGSERDKLLALQKTSQVNDAYQTLKQPLSRAEYILQLRGIDFQHEQKTLQDPEFLMAQMAWRERIESLQANADMDAVAAAMNELQQQTQQLQQTLEQQIDAHSEATDEAAANSVRKLKFMHKLDAELVAIEDKLLD